MPAAGAVPLPSGERCHHRCERSGLVARDHVVRVAPTFAALVEALSNLVWRADQRQRRLQQLVRFDLKHRGYETGEARAVVGHLGEHEPGVELEVVEAIAGAVAYPRDLLVEALGEPILCRGGSTSPE